MPGTHRGVWLSLVWEMHGVRRDFDLRHGMQDAMLGWIP